MVENGMICPRCYETECYGRLGGCLPYTKDNEDEESPGRILRAFYPFIEVRTTYCPACPRFEVDCATMKVKNSFRGSLVTGVLLADEERLDYCPACGMVTEQGKVSGALSYLDDQNPSPGFWRLLFSRNVSVGVEAPALCCRACGWMGIECP